MSDKPWHIEHFKRYFGLIAIKKGFIIAKVFVLILCLVVLLSTPGESRADSSIATGNGAASAHVNFRIHIPATLYLQVGTADRTQDTTQPELNYAKEDNTAPQNKKNFPVKALGRLFKKGTMLLSSNASTIVNNETLFYTLSSP